MDVVNHVHQWFTFRDISIISPTSLPEMILRLLTSLLFEMIHPFRGSIPQIGETLTRHRLFDPFENFRNLIFDRMRMNDEMHVIWHKSICPQIDSNWLRATARLQANRSSS